MPRNPRDVHSRARRIPSATDGHNAEIRAPRTARLDTLAKRYREARRFADAALLRKTDRETEAAAMAARAGAIRESGVGPRQ